MIRPKEINAAAGKYRVKDSQIEKDYVLSWLLYGISRSDVLSKILVFKGGTVLKKVYFEDYRFSEDLDFTLLDEKISDDDLLKGFEKVYAFVKEEANITVQFKESEVHESSGSLVFYVNYIGPLQADIKSRDVKIDITRGEKMEFEIENRPVFREYSDMPEELFLLQCYSLSEVLIEKMAALMGRTQVRDLYDFWHLTENEQMSTNEHKPDFERKAINKKLNPNQFQEKILGKEKNLKQAWQISLEDQIHDLPKFDDVFRESKRHFKF
ncbi:MAG: nucleotidyl transferase AbiEii/AbiGii toxin family protein [Chitinophagaceae bacterium]|nr:nucleotidyl transferase AbiEii/AbiGii toxin family protein [Chitinophagaceae bacterium]